jgi:hypothetical protein
MNRSRIVPLLSAAVGVCLGLGAAVSCGSHCDCPERRPMVPGEYTIRSLTTHGSPPAAFATLQAEKISIQNDVVIVRYQTPEGPGLAKFTIATKR